MAKEVIGAGDRLEKMGGTPLSQQTFAEFKKLFRWKKVRGRGNWGWVMGIRSKDRGEVVTIKGKLAGRKAKEPQWQV